MMNLILKNINGDHQGNLMSMPKLTYSFMNNNFYRRENVFHPTPSIPDRSKEKSGGYFPAATVSVGQTSFILTAGFPELQLLLRLKMGL